VAVEATPADELLSAEEVAARFKVSKRWCYDHQRDLGAVHLSARAVRFPAKKVQQFLAKVGRLAQAA
jgi:predicted DNA-binding transcriptional regulator AlpA